MNRPLLLLLDLFCGAGGCTRGYQLAGFRVIGVDSAAQPHYCGEEFFQEDALSVLDTLLAGGSWHGYHLRDFAAIHASPPCQRFTCMSYNNRVAQMRHPDYIQVVRDRLVATGKPYVIENVGGARRLLINPIMLCGHMFGLRVYRHRYFESNVLLLAHSHVKHVARAAHAGKIPAPDEFWSPVGCFGRKDEAQRAMGIDWMAPSGSRDTEIAEAVPPSYTRYIGEQLMDTLEPMEKRKGATA